MLNTKWFCNIRYHEKFRQIARTRTVDWQLSDGLLWFDEKMQFYYCTTLLRKPYHFSHLKNISWNQCTYILCNFFAVPNVFTIFQKYSQSKAFGFTLAWKVLCEINLHFSTQSSTTVLIDLMNFESKTLEASRNIGNIIHSKTANYS